MGSCVWEMSLSQCPKACLDGSCGDVGCHADTDCAPWGPICKETYPGSAQWNVESCPNPTCQEGACYCNPMIVTNCPFPGTCSNAACSP
jgi:hypothetical protein